MTTRGGPSGPRGGVWRIDRDPHGRSHVGRRGDKLKLQALVEHLRPFDRGIRGENQRQDQQAGGMHLEARG